MSCFEIGNALKTKLKERANQEIANIKNKAREALNNKINEVLNKAKSAANAFLRDKIGKIDKEISKATGGIFGDNLIGGMIERSKIGTILGSFGGDSIINKSSSGNALFSNKYVLGSLIMINKEEVIPFNVSNVLSIENLNQYDFNIMPMMKLVLRITLNKKMWIIKNKRDIKVKFELNKLGKDIEVENDVTTQLPVWNQLFSIYLSDEDEAIDVGEFEKRMSRNLETGMEDESYAEGENTIELYLLDSVLLNASRCTFNKVYTETTLQNVIGQMLTETNHKKVLMSKIENDEVYKELLLPVNPVYKQLIFLDQYYGLYKSGAMIYYDLDRLYILNLSSEITALEEDEYPETVFLVADTNNALPGGGVVVQEGDKVHYAIIHVSDINAQNFTDSQNASEGANTEIIVTDTSDVEFDPAEDEDAATHTVNTQFINDSNRYASEVIEARRVENDNMVYISAMNLDVSAFTPNKRIRMVFNDESLQQKYGGNIYRLAYTYHAFKPDGENYMTASHHIVLKRTEVSKKVVMGRESTRYDPPTHKMGAQTAPSTAGFGFGAGIGNNGSKPHTVQSYGDMIFGHAGMTSQQAFERSKIRGGVFDFINNNDVGKIIRDPGGVGNDLVNMLGDKLGNITNEYIGKFTEGIGGSSRGSSPQFDERLSSSGRRIESSIMGHIEKYKMKIESNIKEKGEG